MHLLGNAEILDKNKQVGIPTVFPLSSSIPGFREGLLLMSEGAKYRLYIPPALGFRDTAPKYLGPNDVLVFDIELVKVEKTVPVR